MAKVKLKQMGEQMTVSRKLEKDEQVNAIELDIVSRGEIPGLCPVEVSRSILGTVLRASLPAVQSMAGELSKGLPFGRFCALILGLVKGVQGSEAHGIRISNLELRAEYIFCQDEEVYLTYWPLISSAAPGGNLRRAFQLLGERYKYPDNDEGYYNAYMGLFEGRERFDIFHFEKAVIKLRDGWYSSRPEERTACPPAAGGAPVREICLACRGGEIIRVNKFPFTLGRDPESCDYVFSGDRMISRSHMSLQSRDGKVYVYDNRSLNGTRINGALIRTQSETAIEPGDLIRIGEQELRYIEDAGDGTK